MSPAAALRTAGPTAAELLGLAERRSARSRRARRPTSSPCPGDPLEGHPRHGEGALRHEGGQGLAKRREVSGPHALAGVLLAGALLLSGCARRGEAGRVIVLGLDGVDPATIDLLMSEGKLPNFARLRREGAYGRLQVAGAAPLAGHLDDDRHRQDARPSTASATSSPSIDDRRAAPGHEPDAPGEGALEHPLRRPAARRTSSAGGRPGPRRTIRGAVVSDHIATTSCSRTALKDDERARHDLSARARGDARSRSGGGRRTSRREELAPFVDVSPEEFARALRLRGRPHPLQVGVRDRRDLHADRPPPLEDRAAGRPARLHRGRRLDVAPLRPPLPRRAASRASSPSSRRSTATPSSRCTSTPTASSASSSPRWTRARRSSSLSDHGFELGGLPDDPSKTRDMRRVSERFHRIEGILYLYGRGVRPRTRLEAPTILDVAPTVLALAGLGAAPTCRGAS